MDAMTVVVIIVSVVFIVGGMYLNRKCDKASREFSEQNRKK